MVDTIQVVKGDYGEVRFCDCMDLDHGLPTLKGNQFDLCITDPPYNLDACRNDQKKQYNKKTGKDIVDVTVKYEDNISNYEDWIREIFKAITWVSKQIIITIGSPNEWLWRKICDPVDVLYHYKKNGNGLTALSWHNRIEPIFLYGKFDTLHKPFVSNVFEIPLDNGFLRLDMNLDHPHPKSIKLWNRLILPLKPKTVLDCFGGSGTTAEVCEENKINYIIFEINSNYVNDIQKRIENGKRNRRNAKIPKRLLHS